MKQCINICEGCNKPFNHNCNSSSCNKCNCQTGSKNFYVNRQESNIKVDCVVDNKRRSNICGCESRREHDYNYNYGINERVFYNNFSCNNNCCDEDCCDNCNQYIFNTLSAYRSNSIIRAAQCNRCNDCY